MLHHDPFSHVQNCQLSYPKKKLFQPLAGETGLNAGFTSNAGYRHKLLNDGHSDEAKPSFWHDL